MKLRPAFQEIVTAARELERDTVPPATVEDARQELQDELDMIDCNLSEGDTPLACVENLAHLIVRAEVMAELLARTIADELLLSVAEELRP